MTIGATIRVEEKTLRLTNGWSASVVTGITGATIATAPGTAAAPALPDADDWRSLLEALTANPADLPGYETLKYSDKGEVFRARFTWSRNHGPDGGGGELEVVCKQSRARRNHGLDWGGWRRRLLAAWRASRERVNFDRGLALLRAGIATALPLAVVEHRAPRRRAWLITQFVPDAVDLDQVALALLPRLEPERQRHVKDAIIRALVDLIDRMTKRGIGHRDLKASNILLTHWDSREEPAYAWLVDLEGLRLRGVFGARRWQPLIRLAASLRCYSSVTRTDFCRFLRDYLARTGRGRDERRRLLLGLSEETTAYLRKAQRRKTGKLDGYNGSSS